jgi:hypothetical protein
MLGLIAKERRGASSAAFFAAQPEKDRFDLQIRISDRGDQLEWIEFTQMLAIRTLEIECDARLDHIPQGTMAHRATIWQRWIRHENEIGTYSDPVKAKLKSTRRWLTVNCSAGAWLAGLRLATIGLFP